MTEFTTWRSLVDGEEISAIPDSAIAQYDATEEPSTGSINSISDLIGDFDLSGNAGVISSGINDQQTYRFDGSQNMSQGTTMATTEPIVIMAVVEQQEATGSNNFYFDGESANDFGLQEDNENEYQPSRGGDNTSQSLGTVTTDPQIIEIQGINNDEIELFQDGASQGVADDISAGDLTGLTLAAQGGGSLQAQIDVGELLVYEEPSSSDLSNERERLADKWGISLP